MEALTTNRLAVSVPVIVDFQGTLTRGVTQELDLQSVSFWSDCDSIVGTTVYGLFYFSRNVAYLPLTGRVTAVEKEIDSSTSQFRIDVSFLPLQTMERRVLGSALQELETYLRALEASEGSTRQAVRETLITKNPRSILSFFITDNPYQLSYRLPTGFGQQISSLGNVDIQGLPAQFTQNMNADLNASSCKKDTSGFSIRMLWQSLGLLVQVLRDLVIRFFPGPLARLFVTPITFAFIGHPRTLSDVPRKFPFARFLPSHVVERWFRYQWPFVASYITGLKLADGTPTTGAMLISPLTTEQMIRDPRLARLRVLQTVQLAEKMGASIAGLGAFTSIVTRDGQELEKKVRLGLTTGNPHSAAIAVQNVLHAAALTNLSLPHATAAIIGGAGSVGSACAKLLARLVEKLLIIDIKKDALHNLVAELANARAAVEGMTNLDRVREADIVIAATNNPNILVTASHLKPGAIVIDAAQPKNVSEEIPHLRPDVVVIESAVVQTPDVSVHFDLDLAEGEALGCLSETMILTAIGWEGHYSLGKADPSHASHIIAAGRRLGFRLARFRNSRGYITDAQLLHIAQSRVPQDAL
ncbi:MAG: hypothetical protein A4E19_15705 [Nitrospira sp. SG-bin1]|nr:MAG: hypothetical protein A4E19_15705 [Nitrospira sp. SG-bin1]